MESNRKNLAADCAQCGACAPGCPVFRAEGRESLTARGRMYLLTQGDQARPSATLADIFACCLLCGACEQVCPRQLPITKLIVEARSHFPLWQRPATSLRQAATGTVLAHPLLLEGLVRAGMSLKHLLALPTNSGLRLRLGLLEEQRAALPLLPENTLPTDDSSLTYFVGCLARHVQPSLATATEKLLHQCGLTAQIPAAQSCCGLATWSAGNLAQARVQAQRNIAAFTGTGAILTSCASCSSHLRSYPSLFADKDPWQQRAQAFAQRVREFTAFFAEYLPQTTGKTQNQRVFYHDPCHLRFTPGGMENPRRLLRKRGLEIVEPDAGPCCCGQGGLFHLAYPATAAKVFARCSYQALAGKPASITSTCSGCLLQYQQELVRQGEKTRVAHLAVLLAEAD